MAVQIKYDNEDPFDGIPVPFVERSIEYIGDNSRSGATEEIVLTGEIPPSPGDCDRFSYFIDEQSSLLNHFSESYKKFEIIEDGVVIVSRENVRVNSVEFDGSNYQSILRYSISLSVFRGDFMKNSGVTDVQNLISYEESEDKTLIISHQVSAVGIRDSSSASSTTALQKAKAFVESEISRQKIDISPIFMSHENVSDDEIPVTPTSTDSVFLATIKPVLRSFNESSNRLSGSYSVTKEYVCDLYFNAGGVMRYSVDVEANPESYVNVSINGTIEYEEDLSGNENFDSLVERYRGFDFFGAAKRLSGQSDLNGVPLSRSMSKDSSKNTLSFSLSFDNNPHFVNENGVEKEISFDFSNTANFVNIEVDGVVSARLGIKNRWEVAKEAFELMDISSEVSSAYASYLSDVLGYDSALMEKMPINTNILSRSVTYNKAAGSVSFSFSFDNFSQTPDNAIFQNFDYTVNLSHPVSNFMPVKEYKGSWIVQDVASSDRGVKSISGSAMKKANVSCEDAMAGIISFINSQESGTLTETQRQISFDGVSSFNFVFSWSTPDSVKMIGESNNGVAPLVLTESDLIGLS